MSIENKRLTFKLFRFNKDTDYLPYYNTIKMEVSSSDTVLDVLERIKKDHDETLTYKLDDDNKELISVKINKQMILASKSNIWELCEIYGNELIIEPQSIKRALNDLIIDKTDFLKKQDITTACEGDNPEKSITTQCTECAICYYSCPVVEINDEFIGPASFYKAWNIISECEGDEKRIKLKKLQDPNSGIWDCVKCNECAQSCPENLDPIGKITKLHIMSFQTNAKLDNTATKYAVGYKNGIEKNGIVNKAELIKYSEGMSALKRLPEIVSMSKRGKLVMPFMSCDANKSKNLDEIKQLVKISSTTTYKG